MIVWQAKSTLEITIENCVKEGLQTELCLGNIDGQRDWGYAPDYMRGVHAVLQCQEPKDFVFATGKLHRVSDWLDVAFTHVGLDWRDFVKFDQRFARTVDPASLVGDAAAARRELGWQPKTSFEDMVREMVDVDLRSA
jgi:GDPmannose 4,6-dehydratase